jgi:RNA polymerase sigma-70 factor (ECF subfamily)
MHKIPTTNKEFRSILSTVSRIAHNVTKYADNADDICQEVMIKVLSSKSVPEEIGTAWLYKVVQNTVNDARRQMAGENMFLDRSLSLDISGSVCETADEARSVYLSGCVDKHHEVEPDLVPRLKEVFSSLTPPLREALVLYADGYNYDEIARVTKTNIGTIRSRLHYAKRHVQPMLAEYR